MSSVHPNPAIVPRLGSRAALSSGALLALTFALTGCHHNPPHVAYQPPPPSATNRHHNEPASNQDETSNETVAEPPGFFDDTSGPPVYTEVGLASWYGPNYNHHNAADGTVYDQDGMTAAHRTLPLGSTVRVTNLQTGQQILVRITDRGPFAPGRILDLSAGAAKAVGLYRMGVGRVRIEAFAHVSPDPPGRWCVQTGPFTTERDALDLKMALIDRYRGAKVSEFPGPTGFWVRIDPAAHDHDEALAIQDWIGNPDPNAAPYLVRID